MKLPEPEEIWVSKTDHALMPIIKYLDDKKVYYTFSFLEDVEDVEDNWHTSMNIEIFMDIYKFHFSKAEYLAKKQFDRDLKELLSEALPEVVNE